MNLFRDKEGKKERGASFLLRGEPGTQMVVTGEGDLKNPWTQEGFMNGPIEAIKIDCIGGH